MHRRTFHTVALLTLAALALQFAAMAAVARLRGSPVAYAFQSPDAAEYVALARGIARQARFVPLDPSGHPTGPPDTWRVPGYPFFLAVVIFCIGDDPLVLLFAQQFLAALTVPILYRILKRFASSRLSLAAAILFMLDPFRLYYSQWLLAETLFLFVMLTALLAYVRARERSFPPADTIALGILAGALVLVRPIGMFLPVLVILGALHGRFVRPTGAVFGNKVMPSVEGRASCPPGNCDARLPLQTHSRPGQPADGPGHRWLPAVLCFIAAATVVFPWLARNHAVAGRYSLSHQSGASFAYHKVADVVLWSQGRHAERFSAAALDEVRGAMDDRLRDKWRERFGPLADRQRETLSWRNLNFGRHDGIDPFVASSLLWEVGWEQLAGRKADLVACFAVQGVGMLIFPLNLVLDPPAGKGSAPLAIIGGGESTVGRAAAVSIGLAYAALVMIALVRLAVAAIRRRPPGALFVLWPMLFLFLPALPFEDPRFRLPLVPLLLVLAVSRPCPKTVVPQ